MDINIELERIIKKYNLDYYYPDYKLMLEAKRLINKYISEHSERILCVARGKSEVERFKYDTGFAANINYVIAHRRYFDNPGTYEKYIDTEAVKKARPEDYDTVLIISYDYEAFIKRFFRETGVKCSSIYEYFLENGLVLQHNYYEFFTDRSLGVFLPNYETDDHMYSNNYFERFYLRKDYENTNNHKYGEICLKKLFFITLLDKDILGAERVVNTLKEAGYDYNNEISALTEIHNLLKNVSEIINKRTSEAIVAFWIDHVAYEHSDCLGFLKKIKNKSIWFSNIYTHTPRTSATLLQIMCGKTVLEDDAYSIKRIDKDSSSFIQSLDLRGYEFYSISGWFASRVDPIYRGYSLIPGYSTFSERNWELLRRLTLQDKKEFILVHEIRETHPPIFNEFVSDGEIGRHTEFNQYDCCETDRQLEFINSFLPQKYLKLYFSDHGGVDWSTKCHTFLSIQRDGINPRIINELTSLKSFGDIVEMLIDTGDVDASRIKTDEIIIQDTRLYNKNSLVHFLKSIENSSIIWGPDWHGYVGIINEDDIYVCSGAGTSILINKNKLSDVGEFNYFFNKVYDSDKVSNYYHKIKHLLPRCKRESELWDIAYKYLYNKESEIFNKKKIAALEDVLKKLPSRNVAIRTGGEHSKYICLMLESIGKLDSVSWIIDNNKECECKSFGIPIVTQNESEALNIETIIWTSKDFLEKLSGEKERHKIKGVNVIDIYEELESRGISFKYSFYQWHVQGIDTVALNRELEKFGY